MTAEVIAFPIGDNADDTIRATVRALLRGRGMSTEDLADAVGISHATMYRRLAAKGSKEAFKAGEVATVARILGVHVGQLYDGLGGTFVPPPNGGGSMTTAEYPHSQPYHDAA